MKQLSFFKNYYSKQELDNLKKTLIILSWIFAFAGVFGFVYEEIFYRIDLGFFIKRGSTYGPWIPIYGFGGILIYLFTQRFNKNPVLIFLTAGAISGVLELATGYVLLHAFDIRLWDYNVEKWNFGNIGGYVCLRSIVFFGISGVFLGLIVKPMFEKLYSKINSRLILHITFIPCLIFIIDMLLYNILR